MKINLIRTRVKGHSIIMLCKNCGKVSIETEHVINLADRKKKIIYECGWCGKKRRLSIFMGGRMEAIYY